MSKQTVLNSTAVHVHTHGEMAENVLFVRISIVQKSLAGEKKKPSLRCVFAL